MEEKELSTREKIFGAALKCISERGYAHVSMRDIAMEAGVALSQVNYHYKGKEYLFKEVLNSVKKEYLHNIEQKLQTIATTKDKLSFLIQYLQELIKSDTKIYQLILDFYSMSMWSETFRLELIAFLKEISEVIEKYIADDYTINENLQVYSSNVLVRVIIGTTFGIAMQYILNHDDEAILDGINILKSAMK